MGAVVCFWLILIFTRNAIQATRRAILILIQTFRTDCTFHCSCQNKRRSPNRTIQTECHANLVVVRTGRAGQTKRLPRHVLNETQWAGHATCVAVRAYRSQKVPSVALGTRRFRIGTLIVDPIFTSATIDAGGFFRDTNTSTPFTAWASFTFTGIGNAFHFGIGAAGAVATALDLALSA